MSDYTRFVKNENKLWAFQTRKLSSAAARARYLAGGKQLEGLLNGTAQALQRDAQPGWQIPRDVARAIVQLRSIGIYGIDFHGGNIGWVPATSEASEASRAPSHPSMPSPESVRRSPPVTGYTEEDLTYRGVRFALFGSRRIGYRVLIYAGGFDNAPVTRGSRDEALAWAHGEIDRVLANTPAPYVGAKVYKVFDVGMSSVGPTAPKPTEIGRLKEDPEPYSRPILARSVKVAELG
jgi:hypothetical protein